MSRSVPRLSEAGKVTSDPCYNECGCGGSGAKTMVEVLGMRLGRYEIRERLGIGGMAVVYRGWDTNLEREVAVKVLHDHLAAEAGFKERFEREAKVVAKLNHPNIVQIYDFDVTEANDLPVYYMVMTYITGRSLKN